MSSKTRIVVLHMKEIIYTAIFLLLAAVLVLLLYFMFRPDEKETSSSVRYTPGVYTSTLSLNNMDLEVEVTVDESHINSIRFSNLDETITTMFPLVQPAIEDLAEQIYEKQSIYSVEIPSDNPYTSRAILNAISTALQKAASPQE